MRGSAAPHLQHRFWSRVAETVGGCWLWTAAKCDNGYGRFRAGSVLVRTHRYAYELMVGDIPEGLDLDHLCRNRACVNPYHLDPVTRGVNVRRGARVVRSLRSS